MVENQIMKSTRFLCVALMIKYTSKTMLLVIRGNYKKTVILITIQKSFFV